MGENIALVREIKYNESGQLLAKIDGKWSYTLTFDVIGECRLDLKLKDSVTNKVISTLTPHNEFMGGSYKFPFVTINDGVLLYDFNGIGGGIITNIKVIKGVR